MGINYYTVGVSSFVKRQYDLEFSGTKISEFDMLNLRKFAEYRLNTNKWKYGYAPFCRIVRINNIFNLEYPIIRISKMNQRFLRTEYKARTDSELPVLVRYFPKTSPIKKQIADYIDVILYSQLQMKKENDSTGASFDIVSVNAEMAEPVPMTPNTILRNALGIKYGGSGKKIDRDQYLQSVKFWSEHAIME